MEYANTLCSSIIKLFIISIILLVFATYHPYRKVHILAIYFVCLFNKYSVNYGRFIYLKVFIYMSDKYSGLSRESLIAKLIAMENNQTVLNDKFKELKSLNKNLNKQNKELNEQKSQLLKENNNLNKTVNAKDNKIIEQNKKLKKKDKEIDKKNQIIENKEKLIENKEQLIKNKEKQIQELEERNIALSEEAVAMVQMLRFFKLDNIASKLEGITEYVDFMRMQNNVIINIATQHENLRQFLFGKGINHNFNAIRDESSIIFEDHSNSGESTPKPSDNEGNGANEGNGSNTPS